MSRQPSEASIVEQLAGDLTSLELGLKIIQREFRVENPNGSSGRIDILARDESQNLVIIEVKRHDVPARQAVHEIFKYVRLVCAQFGLARSQVRCFIVSTTWHELLVPFSELVRLDDYEVEGIQIAVDSDGKILNVQRVDPLTPQIEELNFFAKQQLYLFDTEEQRVEFLEKLESTLSNYEPMEFVAFRVTRFESKRHRNWYDLGVYLAGTDLTRAEKKVLSKHPDLQPRTDGPYTIQEMIFVEIWNECRQYAQEMENGSPRKLVLMLDEWNIEVAIRSGKRLTGSEPILTSRDLQVRISGLDSGKNDNFFRVVSPRHRQAWDNALQSLTIALAYNSQWAYCANAYLSNLAEKHPNAVVSLYIFDQKNLVEVLHPDSCAHEPILDFFAKDENWTANLTGIVTWSGEAIRERPAVLFPGITDSLSGRRWPKDYEADLARHGFSMRLFENTTDCGFQQIVCDESGLKKVAPKAVLTIKDFKEANASYLDMLRESTGRRIQL